MQKTLLCFVLMLWSTSAIAIECKSAKPDNAKGHWAWRQIDGKQCWYEGESGLSKDNLHWPKAKLPSPMSQVEQEEEPAAMTPPEEEHSTPESVTVEEPPMLERTWYDELLLNTCCWPQLDEEFVPLLQRKPIEPKQSNSASTWRFFLFFTLLGGILTFLIIQWRPSWHAMSSAASCHRPSAAVSPPSDTRLAASA